MKNIPEPIFSKKLSKICWTKIFEREYGIQYSEAAIATMAFCSYHFPKLSFSQIVVSTSGQNATFEIDTSSWVELVEGLNKKYTNNLKNLEKYERQFLLDGKSYLDLSKKIQKTNLAKLSNKQLLKIYLDHQDRKLRYSTFAWSAFILNNYVADRAIKILDIYIKQSKKQNIKQEIYDSLFSPHKRAAILELQYLVENKKGKLTSAEFNNLYEKFKWLSCLDIQNKPWTKEEFKENIQSFADSSGKKIIPFEKFIKELKFNKQDLEYLLMAKRFIYIKDARDDFRRKSVYLSNNLFEEIGKRMNQLIADTSYLQEKEIVDFLKKDKKVNPKIISLRKKGFIVYLDKNKKLICLQGNQINVALNTFKISQKKEKPVKIVGNVASQGKAKGPVIIVRGVRDLGKVDYGHVLVAVTTHPDFVPAMRKAVAIVTDEGGITCHAAIVSREFGIPCIVGCKNATKLLKDGDVVEVNAMDGKITKME